MVKIVLEHRTKNIECTRQLVETAKEIRIAASERPGFIFGETMVDADDPCHVIVNSTWKQEDDWKAFDSSFARNLLRNKIEGYLAEPYTPVTLSIPILWQEDLLHVF